MPEQQVSEKTGGRRLTDSPADAGMDQKMGKFFRRLLLLVLFGLFVYVIWKLNGFAR